MWHVHRPTFPSEWQWNQYRREHRCHRVIVVTLVAAAVVIFGWLLWETLVRGINVQFLVGYLVGFIQVMAGLLLTSRWVVSRVMRWGKKEESDD